MAEAQTAPPPEEAPPEEPPPIGRQAPHSLEAEEALIGSMLLSRGAIELAISLLVPSDFYAPANGRLFQAISALAAAGRPADPVTVAGWLADHDPDPEIPQKRIAQLQAATPSSASAAAYAQRIAEMSSRRRLALAASKISGLAFDMSISPADALADAEQLIRGADIILGGEPADDLGAFLAKTEEHRWAWPGCLEVGERLLIVAPEKFGKSTMIRQIAVLLAQGQDPFTRASIPPCLVYMLDLENPPSLARRKISEIFAAINSLERPAQTDTMRVECRPQGLVLSERADLMWLLDRLAANRAAWERLGYDPKKIPLICCIGPIYKLLDNELDQVEVKRCARILDQIRARFDCALIMETHAPHESFGPKAGASSLRPSGPRLWLRWPEFCKGVEPFEGADSSKSLARFYDVQGARDERAFPTMLIRGGGKDPAGIPRLPWTVNDPKF